MAYNIPGQSFIETGTRPEAKTWPDGESIDTWNPKQDRRIMQRRIEEDRRGNEAYKNEQLDEVQKVHVKIADDLID